MTETQIREYLEALEARLEDIEETFNFTLANTNTHLADAMVIEFEEELNEYRERVATIRRILEERF